MGNEAEDNESFEVVITAVTSSVMSDAGSRVVVTIEDNDTVGAGVFRPSLRRGDWWWIFTLAAILVCCCCCMFFCAVLALRNSLESQREAVVGDDWSAYLYAHYEAETFGKGNDAGTGESDCLHGKALTVPDFGASEGSDGVDGANDELDASIGKFNFGKFNLSPADELDFGVDDSENPGIDLDTFEMLS